MSEQHSELLGTLPVELQASLLPMKGELST
jgi:hypothetical protein